VNELNCKKFEQMGARAKFVPTRPNWRGELDERGMEVNIRRDHKGAYFEITSGPTVEFEVVDIRPKDRHLLLMARRPDDRPFAAELKSKFLCGHDERDWFVAAIPESRPAANVAGAMEALKPSDVLQAQVRKGVKHKDKCRRKTAAYLRQGEWFFLPVPDWTANGREILRDEPLQRGRGKPHMAEMLCRQGGETVYVNDRYPNGLTEKEYRRLQKWAKEPLPHFRVMRRNASVMVRGTIRHRDHKTVYLDCWHMVLPNTETEAKASRNVAFLD